MGTTSKKTTTAIAPARRARRTSAPPTAVEPQAENQTQATSVSSRLRPSRDQIARLAYRYYVESGYAPGRDVDNWLRAEAELSRP